MNTIKTQFQDMLESGVIPRFKMQINKGGYLLVNLSAQPDGIAFEFDSNSLPIKFAGTIKELDSNHYLLPYDEYKTDLNTYLDIIYTNVFDGYILVNNLLPDY